MDHIIWTISIAGLIKSFKVDKFSMTEVYKEVTTFVGQFEQSLTNKTNEQIEIQKDALLSRKTMARINFFDQFADNDEVIITGETSFDNNVKYSSFSGSITVNDLLEVYRKTMLDNPRIWVAIIEVNDS